MSKTKMHIGAWMVSLMAAGLVSFILTFMCKISVF